MKRLLMLLAILSAAVRAYAVDPTTAALDAPLVDDFITLSLGPGNDRETIVKYTIDTNPSPKAVNGLTFRSKGEIAIHLSNLNPLTQVWVVEAKATPDVSYAAIKAFLDDLTALQAALPQPGGPAGGAAPLNREDCSRLNDLIIDAHGALTNEDVTAKILQEIVAGATGHAGVNNASTRLKEKQTEIENNIKTARKALADIRVEFGALSNQPSKVCSQVNAQILVDYIQVQSTADRIIAAKEALRGQLGELVEILKPYLQQNVWFAPNHTDYIIKTVKPTFAEQQNVTVTAKDRTIALVNGSIEITTDDAHVTTGTFVVRKNSFFVTERAAAVVYNSLTYPQYGTAKNEQGETVVKRTDDHEPVGGALMLNLITRFAGGSVAYPFIQFGVSSAKDYPGFLAGIGYRFVEPFNFSFSVGGMITRYKDLDGDLNVDDPVSGTSEINDHLTYKTSPVVLYGAVQVKF